MFMINNNNVIFRNRVEMDILNKLLELKKLYTFYLHKLFIIN